MAPPSPKSLVVRRVEDKPILAVTVGQANIPVDRYIIQIRRQNPIPGDSNPLQEKFMDVPTDLNTLIETQFRNLTPGEIYEISAFTVVNRIRSRPFSTFGSIGIKIIFYND